MADEASISFDVDYDGIQLRFGGSVQNPVADFFRSHAPERQIQSSYMEPGKNYTHLGTRLKFRP
jgi:hypothetical protein